METTHQYKVKVKYRLSTNDALFVKSVRFTEAFFMTFGLLALASFIFGIFLGIIFTFIGILIYFFLFLKNQLFAQDPIFFDSEYLYKREKIIAPLSDIISIEHVARFKKIDFLHLIQYKTSLNTKKKLYFHASYGFDYSIFEDAIRKGLNPSMPNLA